MFAVVHIWGSRVGVAHRGTPDYLAGLIKYAMRAGIASLD